MIIACFNMICSGRPPWPTGRLTPLGVCRGTTEPAISPWDGLPPECTGEQRLEGGVGALGRRASEVVLGWLLARPDGTEVRARSVGRVAGASERTPLCRGIRLAVVGQ